MKDDQAERVEALRSAAQCASGVLWLLNREVEALGFNAKNVKPKLDAALAALAAQPAEGMKDDQGRGEYERLMCAVDAFQKDPSDANRTCLKLMVKNAIDAAQPAEGIERDAARWRAIKGNSLCRHSVLGAFPSEWDSIADAAIAASQGGKP